MRSICAVVALLLMSSAEALASSSPPVMSLTTTPLSPSEKKVLPIVVVGAGFAGLSLAIGVADASGRPVHVLESRPSFADRAGATFGLAPCGIKALQELCPAALEQIVRQGIRLPTAGYMLPWYVVRDALLDQARQRSDRITIHTGCKLLKIDENSKDDSCVRVVFTESNQVVEAGVEPSPQEKELKACLLVGCDGVRSQVRNYLGLPKSNRVQNLWRGTITVPTSNFPRAAALIEQGPTPLGLIKKYGPVAVSIFNFHPSTPYTIAWSMFGDFPQLPAQSNVWELLEPYLEEGDEKEVLREIVELSNESDLRTMLEYSTIDPRAAAAAPSQKTLSNGASGWGGRGRITLSGDSAHCMRPVTGLGGSMAFEDSVVLCRVIRAASQNDGVDTDWKEVVQTFEASRMERVVRIWDDEWDRAEYFRKTGVPKPFSEEFTQWLSAGV